MGLIIDKDSCIQCGACVLSCPNGALSIEAEVTVSEEKCILCGACADTCPVGAITVEKDTEEKTAQASGVWVAVQQKEGKALPVAFELINKGRVLADELKCGLTAVCIGKEKAFAKELIYAGADRVLACTADWIEDTDDAVFAELLITLIRERAPEIVLFGATILGRAAAPRVAAALGTGLTADCTALTIEKESGLLAQTRPALGGNLMATIICPHRRPQMATVRPGVLQMPEMDNSRKGIIEEIAPPKSHSAVLQIISSAKKQEGTGISDAKILLVAGKGIGSKKNLKKIYELAALLQAEVGVSRPLIDLGWEEYPHQVGQTGTSVAPDLLISLGVSGAIQHLAGMNGAKTVVAVNTDPDAPIFGRADYAVIGDCMEFVREMTDLLKQ